MNVFWHAASAAPFLALGMPWAALGAVAPDATWVYNEIDYRRSGVKRWQDWCDRIPEYMVVPYRVAHSALIVVPVCAYAGAWEFLAGWAVHVIMDLPTHRGRMQQQPFYPIKWRWPWVLT